MINLPVDCSADWRGTGGSDLSAAEGRDEGSHSLGIASGQFLSLRVGPR